MGYATALRKARYAVRDATPQWARQAVKWGTVPGQAYQFLKNQGVGQAAMRAEAAEPAQATDTNYVWQDNGSGGINYFYGGQPITNQQYREGTGIDTNQLEADHYQEYVNSQSGGGTPPSDGSGSGGTQAPTFNRYLGGTQYSDPIAYTNAVTEASLAEFNRQNKLLTDAYNSGLLDFATYQDQIKQSRNTIKEQYSQAMSSIGGRFSANSPDAYQSAQGGAENRATEITNQNYANVAGQEANLNLQRSQYDTDYANNLESNRIASQNQIDQTINSTSEALADTPYANKMGGINAPKLNTMTPMDSSILGVYDNLSQLQSSGNTAAIKSTIDQLQAEPSVKDWLYTRFNPQTI